MLYAVAKTVIKKFYDERRLKLWAIAAEFQLFFIVKLNLELYERPEPLVKKVVAASL